MSGRPRLAGGCPLDGRVRLDSASRRWRGIDVAPHQLPAHRAKLERKLICAGPAVRSLFALVRHLPGPHVDGGAIPKAERVGRLSVR